MWGTFGIPLSDGIGKRFIPTYVGNIIERLRRLWSDSVHPHVCGEHRGLILNQRQNNGSSPRMWGTWLRRSDRFFCRRFIPTYVGNICVSVASADGIVGSSPRMWGTCIMPRQDIPIQRFIPTYVGNIRLLLPVWR